MGNIKFNNRDSTKLGIIVQTPPTYVYPERDIETKHIPGRNGDLVIDNNCFKNVNRTYSIAKVYPKNIIGSRFTAYTMCASEINEWLHSAGADYTILEDDYDPDVYRLAKYSESASFTDVCEGALIGNITFECKPQRFLKSGLVPEVFGSEVHMTNQSVYDALPLINIRTGGAETDAILLLTTTSSQLESDGIVEKVVSTITIPSTLTDVWIDSEKQTCYVNHYNSESELIEPGKSSIDYVEDVNYLVSLNGKSFPYLGKQATTLKVDQYSQKSLTIDRYSSVIASEQTICKAEYKSQDILISEQEEKVFIVSYNSVVDSCAKEFTAKSYQSYVTSLANKGLYDSSQDPATTIAGEYTFQSFNKVLDSIATQFSIVGNINDNVNLSGSGNGYIRAVQDGDTLKVYTTIEGYFLSSNDKLIKLYQIGALIAEVKNYSSLTINYYPTKDIVGSGKVIDVSYDDLPDWLDFSIQYTLIDGIKSPKSISFIAKRQGTYWLDKQWTFGKPKWLYLSAGSTLNEMDWSNTKKAFMPKQGITTSTSITYTYRFVDRTLQYSLSTEDDTYVYVFRESVPAGSDDLVTITLKTDREGYYSYQLNDNESTRVNWVHKNQNDNLVTISGTDSFQIFYLESIPKYTDSDKYVTDTGESTWPSWLDPNIYPVPENNYLNSTRIKMKVLQNGYYRYTYTDSEGEKYTNWLHLNSEDIIDFNLIGYNKTANDSFYISRIEEIPNEYTNDRCYTVDDQPTSETAPSWLGVVYTAPTDELPNGEISYSAAANGYYKWDTNSAWLQKNQGETLFTSGVKDDSIIYYMSELPDYSDYDVCSVSHREDSTGNPTNIIVTATVDGYYRVNYNSDWTYYYEGDVIYEATASEEVRISYLELIEMSETFFCEIEITPRWWVL